MSKNKYFLTLDGLYLSTQGNTLDNGDNIPNSNNLYVADPGVVAPNSS